MTNNWRIVTVAIVLLLMPLAASAFGPNGHRIVAHIATLHMDSNARREIVRLLGDQSLESVSTWPDDMRDSPDQDYWKKAAAWHFVSVPDGENYLTATKTPNGDAYTQLLYFLSQLRSQMTSQEDRAIALKWVAHIVGDLHQPLHCGHTADAGGNDINVSWFDQTKNLHEVWDIGLIEYDNLSFSEYADFINVTDESRVAVIQEASIIDWIDESVKLNKTIYKLPSTELGYQYAFDYSPMVKQQLLKAGLRLAALLDNVLAVNGQEIQ